MPYGNGMGPMGMGPMSGRGMGHCAGNGQPGYFSGRGRGRGFFGFGRMAGRRFYAQPLSREEQRAEMKSRAEFLRAELEELEQQLKDMETGN